MAEYTGKQLEGMGILTEALTAGVTYTFTFTTPPTLRGSAYFTLETVRNSNGFYVGIDENAEGTINTLASIQTLLQTPFKFSVVVQQGAGSFNFTPTNNIPLGGALLRATGNIALDITPAADTAFKITVNTGTTFPFRIQPQAGMNLVIDWGDGSSSNIGSSTDTELTHNYATPGTYQISAEGQFNGPNFNGLTPIISLDNWGTSEFTEWQNAFKGCRNMVGNYTDTPNTSNVTNMDHAFHTCTIFNSPLNFDTANVTSFGNFLREASSFNQPITFDLSSALVCNSMFRSATQMNSPVTLTNTGNVTNMFTMFTFCSAFNSDLNFDDTSAVANMEYMFYQAFAFNQDISDWDVTSLTTFNFGLTQTSFDTTNYDLLLTNWSTYSPLQTGVPFSAGTAKYSPGAAATARGVLTSAPNNWIVTDGGQV